MKSNGELVRSTTDVEARSTIGEILKSKARQISAALPKHMTAEKVLRISMTEVQKNPALRECTAASLVACIIQAAQLGLFPDSVSGEAYLVPFRDSARQCMVCTLIPGYRGLIKLAYNSGLVVDIDAQEVCRGDVFEFRYGTGARLTHRIAIEEERGDVLCYYAIAQLRNGHTKFKVMSLSDIERHRKYSKTSRVWGAHYEEMAKKTAIRVLLKYLPTSADNLNLAIMLDEQADRGAQNLERDILVVDDAEIESKSQKLVNTINSKQEGTQDEQQ